MATRKKLHIGSSHTTPHLPKTTAPPKKTTESTTFFGGAFMLLWWLVVLFTGYPVFGVSSLVVALAIMASASFLKDEGTEGFLGRVGNNNWILRTASWMLFGVILLWWLDPTTPPGGLVLLRNVGEIWQNPQGWVWGQVKGLTETSPSQLVDPLGRFGWRSINNLFFGRGGVGPGVFVFHLVAWFFSVWVSRWDEIRNGLKKISHGGVGELATRHTLGEVVTFPLEWLANKIFKLKE